MHSSKGTSVKSLTRQRPITANRENREVTNVHSVLGLQSESLSSVLDSQKSNPGSATNEPSDRGQGA